MNKFKDAIQILLDMTFQNIEFLKIRVYHKALFLI